MIKKITTVIALTLTATSVYAAQNGVYLGGQLGYANIDNTPDSLNVVYANSAIGPVRNIQPTSVDNGQFGARLFTGYQFNKFFALELGLTGYSPTEVNNLYGYQGNIDDTVNQLAIDGVGKLMLPIGQKFNLYAKGGAAYVITNDFDADVIQYTNSHNYNVTYEKNVVTSVRPTYGFGASYDFTPKLSADISWSQIVGGDNVPRTNFTALGLAYHFG